KTVAENLRKWKTGGLRRLSADKPFPEVVPSGRTPKREEAISDHPCLKPQHFMRIIVRALLPLGEGTVLDPFMGSGSTIAAAETIGYESIGIELDGDYFKQAQAAIPRLAALYPAYKGESLTFDVDYKQIIDEPHNQLSFGLAEQSPAYSVKTAPHPKKISATAGTRRPKKARNQAKAA